ncbi:hypothetical protein PRO82_001064 [Candidatus Protochlamydia amoebophila]|nr:hypothetical protein [Candidatus Protochlamydia amoebophila]
MKFAAAAPMQRSVHKRMDTTDFWIIMSKNQINCLHSYP